MRRWSPIARISAPLADLKQVSVVSSASPKSRKSSRETSASGSMAKATYKAAERGQAHVRRR
jgi:hypothetical protein